MVQREQIIRLRKEGLSLPQIASKLGVSLNAVAYHLYPKVKRGMIRNAKKYQKEHPEKHLICAKRYYQKHKKKVLERLRNRRLKEKIRKMRNKHIPLWSIASKTNLSLSEVINYISSSSTKNKEV